MGKREENKNRNAKLNDLEAEAEKEAIGNWIVNLKKGHNTTNSQSILQPCKSKGFDIESQRALKKMASQ